MTIVVTFADCDLQGVVEQKPVTTNVFLDPIGVRSGNPERLSRSISPSTDFGDAGKTRLTVSSPAFKSTVEKEGPLVR